MAEADEVAYEIVRSLRRIIRSVGIHSKRLARDAGLTLPQVLCLRALAHGERATVAQVSDAVGLSAATVSGIIERLFRGGLVERERGETDRRKVWVSITAAGRERLAALPTLLQQRFLERVMALPPAERRDLLASLKRIVELMDAEEVEAAPILVADEDPV